MEVFARRPEDVWKTEKVLHFPNAKKTSSSFGRFLDVRWTLLVSMDVQMTSYGGHNNQSKTSYGGHNNQSKTCLYGGCGQTSWRRLEDWKSVTLQTQRRRRTSYWRYLYVIWTFLKLWTSKWRPIGLIATTGRRFHKVWRTSQWRHQMTLPWRLDDVILPEAKTEFRRLLDVVWTWY